MSALVLGAALAIVALAFVLYPLFARPAGARTAPRPVMPDAAVSPEPDRAIAALQEIQFEHATGKLSDADYERLREEYARAAAPVDVAVPSDDDAAESFIRAYRARQPVCPQCGPRPETDARYCSTCGRPLASGCPRCGAPTAGADASYCTSCGAALGP